MNIFVTSSCPVQSAKNLDDKRVVKMILECAQIMSTTGHVLGVSNISPYRKTHENHPCSIWTRKCSGNYKWVLEHFNALCAEYTQRYGKVHACVQYLTNFKSICDNVPSGDLVDFVNCAKNASLGIDYTKQSDVVLAYQLYLNDRWDTDSRVPTWYGISC